MTEALASMPAAPSRYPVSIVCVPWVMLKVAVPITAPNTSRAAVPLICRAMTSVRLALKAGMRLVGSLVLLVASTS